MQLERGVSIGRLLGHSLAVHICFVPFIGLVFVTVPSDWALQVCLGLAAAAATSELVGSLIARVTRVDISSSVVFPFGPVWRTEPTRSIAPWLGSSIALIGAGVAMRHKHFGIAVLVVGVVGLLPVFPLNGGRLLAIFLGGRQSELFSAGLGRLVSAALVLVGGALWFVTKSLVWALPVGTAFILFSVSAREVRYLRRLIKHGRAAVSTVARPFEATLSGDERVGSVRGGGPYLIARTGALEGVVLASSLDGDPGESVRERMIPWKRQQGIYEDATIEQAEVSLRAAPGGVLVVLARDGRVAGLYSEEL